MNLTVLHAPTMTAWKELMPPLGLETAFPTWTISPEHSHLLKQQARGPAPPLCSSLMLETASGSHAMPLFNNSQNSAWGWQQRRDMTGATPSLSAFLRAFAAAFPVSWKPFPSCCAQCFRHCSLSVWGLGFFALCWNSKTRPSRFPIFPPLVGPPTYLPPDFSSKALGYSLCVFDE